MLKTSKKVTMVVFVIFNSMLKALKHTHIIALLVDLYPFVVDLYLV